MSRELGHIMDDEDPWLANVAELLGSARPNLPIAFVGGDAGDDGADLGGRAAVSKRPAAAVLKRPAAYRIDLCGRGLVECKISLGILASICLEFAICKRGHCNFQISRLEMKLQFPGLEI